MEKAFHNKQEILDRIRKRMDEYKTNPCDDWFYQTLEIIVCDVNYGDGVCVVPEVVGRLLEKQIANPKNNSKVLSIGDVVVRAYSIKNLSFHRGRFASLNEWGKKAYLKQNPDVFKEVENNFSADLKKYLQGLKKEIENAKD